MNVGSTEDITAGDGATHDVLHGKAAASTRTTSNVFRLLQRNGIPTNFVDRVDDGALRARDVKMIPLELVARRYAAGSLRQLRFADSAVTAQAAATRARRIRQSGRPAPSHAKL